MKKFVLLSLVFIFAALSGYYYVFMKPRFVSWLGELFPGAEVSCSYVTPLPFANRVYAGNVEIFRKGKDGKKPDFFLYCDTLIHYKEDDVTGKDGNKKPVLVLEAKNLAVTMSDLGFSLDNLAVAWHMDIASAKYGKAAATTDPELIISRLDGSNLHIEKAKKHIFSIHTLQGRDCIFLPQEWEQRTRVFLDNPWHFALNKHASIGELVLQGLTVPGKDEKAASFHSKITMQGESAPTKLEFHMQALN